jgi:hypothetical protein
VILLCEVFNSHVRVSSVEVVPATLTTRALLCGSSGKIFISKTNRKRMHKGALDCNLRVQVQGACSTGFEVTSDKRNEVCGSWICVCV